MGGTKAGSFFIRLKMAGLVPAKKSASAAGMKIHRRESPLLPPVVCIPGSFRKESGPILDRSKFTACAYHVNKFANLFLAVAGVMRRFNSRSRQIKKNSIVSKI
jgi:hypothetical protein